MLCPRCGAHIHRSHTRGFGERLVRTFTSHKVYRCYECNWRGWLRKGDPIKRRQTLRTIISVLVTLLLTTLLALYVVEKLNGPAPNPGLEQRQAP